MGDGGFGKGKDGGKGFGDKGKGKGKGNGKCNGGDDRLTQLRSKAFEAHGADTVWHFRNMLLDTEDAYIMEGNVWGDDFWGKVVKSGRLVGENNLGKILMSLRVRSSVPNWCANR